MLRFEGNNSKGQLLIKASKIARPLDKGNAEFGNKIENAKSHNGSFKYPLVTLKASNNSLWTLGCYEVSFPCTKLD